MAVTSATFGWVRQLQSTSGLWALLLVAACSSSSGDDATGNTAGNGSGVSGGGALSSAGTAGTPAASGGAGAGTSGGGGGAVTTGGSNAGSASGGLSAGGTTAGQSAGGASEPTLGCGKATWPPSNDQEGGTAHTLDIGGTMRELYVSVPADYDSSKPTRVVFAWHWLGGTARNVISGNFGGGYYGLKSRMPGAIYVAAQGLGGAGQTGWPNTGGRDIAFLNAMLKWLDENYCVDKARIFSVGFSYGGIMSDTVACQLGSTFRAVAPFAGAMFGSGNNCVKQRVAAHITHGTADDTVEIAGGIAARDYLIAANHCTMTTQPVEPSPCVAYQGCDEGYPVVWCEHPGNHTIPSFAQPAVATFFQQF